MVVRASARQTGSGSRLNLRIRGRLILGFALVCAVLVGIVGTTIVQTSQVTEDIERVDGLRVPTAIAAAALSEEVQATLATLRGWMLTGKPGFKADRAQAWAEMDRQVAEMDQLSQRFTNAQNIDRWRQFKPILEEFRKAQQQVEDIANSEDEQPATKILLGQAAPRAASIVTNITRMIDDEMNQDSSAARKELLGAMADVRGSMAMALASIRAYLLSGDDKFRGEFESHWATNDKRFADLSRMAGLFTVDQSRAFAELKKMREEFAPLPPKMIEIRGSDQWNMAIYQLVTEAAPRAEKLLTILHGEKQADGSRRGGMADSQRTLLKQDSEAALGAASMMLTTVWILLIAGIAMAGVIVYLSSRSIVDPIAALTGVMDRLAGGEKTVAIPSTEKSDEVGDMARAVLVFKENMIRNDELTAIQAAEQQAKVVRAQQVVSIIATFDSQVAGVLQGVGSAAEELERTAQAMSATAEQASHQANAVAAASNQASANVQTVATAAEELSASISEIGRQVNQSTKIAANAVEEAEHTNRTVQGLAEAAQKIGDVVNLINNIAGQTNLLALNATIEAARAGEAGKGFAVVAQEVKNLANQTSKATDEISAQILSVQQETQGAVGAIQKILQIIGELSDISTSIAAAVEEQGVSTQEIARNVQQAAQGTQQVNENIGGVTDAASQTGAAANQVLSSSGELGKQAEELRGHVDAFLRDVKAA